MMGAGMEGLDGRKVEDGGSSEGRPPKPLAGDYRKCFSAAHVAVPCARPRVHEGRFIIKENFGTTRVKTSFDTSIMDVGEQAVGEREDIDTSFLPGANFIPLLRSGGWSDRGHRQNMEDAHICIDNIMNCYGLEYYSEGPNAFYGVFDGHGGKHAADFVCSNLPRLIVEDEDFPMEIERVVASAFMQADSAFADACSSDSKLDSGTTALAALVVGRSLVVANAGDCRAVLSRRGKAIEMSRDHKPACSLERKRIEASGGYVDDGYLNGQLNVARALGDWHMEGMKGEKGLGPLSAEPEMMRTNLTDEDEFLIIACDGIWDVFRSQNAVDFARRKLQEHNDPVLCCKELVDEALKRKSSDNLSVIIVCFQSRPPPSLSMPRVRVHRSISAEGLKELQGFLDSLEN